MKAQLEDLVQITGVALRAQQAELVAIQRHEEDLRLNLAQLTASKSTQAQSNRASDDAALVAGADMRWHLWVDQRRALINAELARVLAQKENCREKLKRAFGRDQAAVALKVRHASTRETLKRRRRAYES